MSEKKKSSSTVSRHGRGSRAGSPSPLLPAAPVPPGDVTAGCQRTLSPARPAPGGGFSHSTPSHTQDSRPAATLRRDYDGVGQQVLDADSTLRPRLVNEETTLPDRSVPPGNEVLSPSSRSSRRRLRSLPDYDEATLLHRRGGRRDDDEASLASGLNRHRDFSPSSARRAVYQRYDETTIRPSVHERPDYQHYDPSLTTLDYDKATSRPLHRDYDAATSRPKDHYYVETTKRQDYDASASRPHEQHYHETTMRPLPQDYDTSSSRPDNRDYVKTTTRPSHQYYDDATLRPFSRVSSETTLRPTVVKGAKTTKVQHQDYDYATSTQAPPKKTTSPSSGSSVRGSSLRGTKIRVCDQCKRTRMSNLAKDPHLLCIGCRGVDCDIDHRCIQCQGWSSTVFNTFLGFSKMSKRQKRYRARRGGSGVSVANVSKSLPTHNIPAHNISLDDVSATVGPEDSASQAPSVRSMSSGTILSKVRREVLEPFASQFEARLDAKLSSLVDILKGPSSKSENKTQETKDCGTDTSNNNNNNNNNVDLFSTIIPPSVSPSQEVGNVIFQEPQIP